MKNNETMVYVVKVARMVEETGIEQDEIVFVTLSQEKAHDFVDVYGVREFMNIEGYTLDEVPL